MKTKQKITAFAVLGILMLMAVSVVSAQANQTNQTGGTCNNNRVCDAGETATSCPADCATGIAQVSCMLAAAAKEFVPVIAVVMLFAAGAYYMSAGNDIQAKANAKANILNVVIGMLIIYLAVWIVGLFFNVTSLACWRIF